MLFGFTVLLYLAFLQLTVALSNANDAQCKHGQTVAMRTADGAIVTLGTTLCNGVDDFVIFTEAENALEALEKTSNKQCLGVLSSNGNFICHTLYPSPAKQDIVAHTGIIAAWVGSELHYMPQVGNQNKVGTDKAQQNSESSKPAIEFAWRATQQSPAVQYISAEPKLAKAKDSEQPFYIKYWYLFLPIVLIFAGGLGK